MSVVRGHPFWALVDDTGAEPGDGAVAVVRGRAGRFAATYAKRFTAAVDCLMADFASLTTYLRFPAGHHTRNHARALPP